MPDCYNHVIVMPTRNREAVALQSLQAMKGLVNTPDVTFVLSDNSDVPSTLICKFCRAAGLVYLRPPVVLSMTAHWNWIIRSFDWSAITFVSDRSFLLDEVYLQMKDLCRLTQKSVVCDAGFLTFRNALGLTGWKFSGRRSDWRIHEVVSGDLVKSVAKNMTGLGFPMLLKTILIRRDWEMTLNRYPDTLTSYGPDAEFAFKRMLSEPTGSSLFIDRIGVIDHSSHLSNAGGSKNPAASSTFRDFVRLNNLREFDYSPYPERITVLNSIVHEFNKAQEEIGQPWTFDAATVEQLEDEEKTRHRSRLAAKLFPLLGADREEFAIAGIGASFSDVPRATLLRQYWASTRELPWNTSERPK